LDLTFSSGASFCFLFFSPCVMSHIYTIDRVDY
jgi:hypothetical protein